MRSTDILLCGGLAVGLVLPFRFSVPSSVVGSISLLDVAVAMGVAVLVARFIGGGVISFGDDRVLILLSIPFALAVVSMIWSSDATSTVRAAILSLEAIGAYLVVVNTLERAAPGTHFLVASGIIVGLVIFSTAFWVGIVDIAPQFTSELSDRELLTYYARLSHPFLGRSSDLSSVIAMFLFVVAGAWVVQRRVMWAVSVVVGLVGVALTLTRGVILALVVGVIAFGLSIGRRETKLNISRRIVGLMAGGVAIALLAVIAVVSLSPGFATPLAENLRNRLALSGYQVRVENVSLAWDVIMRNPLVGLGGGNLGGGILAERGGVHNTYLEAMINYGIVLGLVASAALVLVALRLYSYRSSAPLSDATLVLVSAGFATVVTQLIVFVGETTYEAATPRVAFFMSVGLVVSLVRATARGHHPEEVDLVLMVDSGMHR